MMTNNSAGDAININTKSEVTKLFETMEYGKASETDTVAHVSCYIYFMNYFFKFN